MPSAAQSKPSFKNGVIYLSKFISSDYFISLKNNSNDLDLVDTLYLRSVKYYESDYSEAMLALTFACLPYNEMHLKLPIFPVTLTLHLPTVSNPLFDIKTKNLPSQLFFDTPKNNFGDKDKLSHFFGNAFIECNFSFFNLSKFLGIFVERFEETFKVQGAMDKRDLYVNDLGAEFGKGLKGNNRLLPSEILKNYSYNKK
jgi:hypothetical protein